MDWHDIGVRALKTAAQTALAILIPALTVEVVGNPDALMRLATVIGVSALAAGLYVVNNAILGQLKAAK